MPNEATAPQLRKQDDPNFLSKKRRVRELGAVGSSAVVDRFVRQSSTIYYKTASSIFSQNGLVYEQGVKLLELPRTLGDDNLSLQQAVREAVFEGDVRVFCTCPAYHYWGFKFIDSTIDAAIRREGRFPVIRNPGLKGTLCKHLHQALQVLPFNAGFIMKEVRLRREDQEKRRRERRRSGRNEQVIQADLLAEFMFGMLTPKEFLEWTLNPERDQFDMAVREAKAETEQIGPVVNMKKFLGGRDGESI